MSLLPSPEEFDSRYDDDEELVAELPERPITSVRDLQYLYGRLYTLATAGSGDYAAYLTPAKAQDLVGEPESLVALRVDLSGETPELAAEPISVTSYEAEDAARVSYCWFNAARGIDHSVTHRTGRNKEPAKVGGYLYERLDRWATDEVVQSVAADHEDGWIIEALAELSEVEELEERIVEATERWLDGTTTALTTVRVRLDPDGEYLYPGECGSDVFDAAMRARKLSKLVSKGKASESAGDATDLVTGERARTVGTAEDPLNYFLGKQLEKFPGFDPDEAWRTHPVSEDVAVTLMNAQPFVDACVYYTLGANVFYLPYFFGRVTPEDARELYALLYDTVEKEKMTPVERTYESLKARERFDERASDLRFYVTAVMRHQSKRFDVFGDTLHGSILSPSDLADAHAEVLNSWVFEGSNDARISPAFPTHENWSLLAGTDLLRCIAGGAYFKQTFAEEDDDDASADDYRIQALVATLSGDSLDVDRVLEEYVGRLLKDEGDGFPSFRVASQFVQLCALAHAELLATDGDESRIEPPTYDTRMTNPTPVRADGGGAAQARETKLAQFLDETPTLNDDIERRGAFLLGVLVGQVSGYQQVSENRSTTMVDQYPIKAITANKLKRLTGEVLDKDIVYSRENGMASTMYREVVDRLVGTLKHVDEQGWELDTTDLRFYYSLGVSYGLNNWTKGDDEPTDDRDPDTEEF